MLMSVLVGFLNHSFQPHLDQMQHRSVDDSASHRSEKFGMRKTIEVATEIYVNNFSIPGIDQLVDLSYRIQCATVPPAGILLRLQIRFENWFENQDCRRLRHPVSDSGYP
jgi:hypothetical protein